MATVILFAGAGACESNPFLLAVVEQGVVNKLAAIIGVQPQQREW